MKGKKIVYAIFSDNLKKYFNKREREKDIKKEIKKGNKLKEKGKKEKQRKKKSNIILISINISIDIIPSVSFPSNLSISLPKNVLPKIFNKSIIN